MHWKIWIAELSVLGMFLPSAEVSGVRDYQVSGGITWQKTGALINTTVQISYVTICSLYESLENVLFIYLEVAAFEIGITVWLVR